MSRLRIPITLATAVVALLAAVGFLAPSAQAAAIGPGPTSASPPTQSGSSSAAAWECSTGSLCVYRGIYGESSRCVWSDADPDWRSGAITCSWSSSPVRSAYNLGASTGYNGVRLYSGANYTGNYICISQHGGYIPDFSMVVRSHRWVTGAC